MAEDPDNDYFKRLLDLVPPQFYFNEETKDKIRNKDTEEPIKAGKGGKKKQTDPLRNQTVSALQTSLNAMDEKIKGKKESKQKKKNKTKEKAATGDSSTVQELQDKLQSRLSQLKAKRLNGLSSVEAQEQKRLERKQRRLEAKNGRKKKKNKNPKALTNGAQSAEGSQQLSSKRPNKPIVNKEGRVVFSKFDFTQSGDKDKSSSNLVGRDYKRLLQRLEQRDAKVAKMKESNPEAAAKLESKHVWQDVLSKAKGEKVKDDPTLLKKAVERRNKLKDQRRKKWDNRTKIVEKQKHQKQEKREKNLQKRKDDKKATKRKKLIKKGRLLPGFV